MKISQEYSFDYFGLHLAASNRITNHPTHSSDQRTLTMLQRFFFHSYQFINGKRAEFIHQCLSIIFELNWSTFLLTGILLFLILDILLVGLITLFIHSYKYNIIIYTKQLNCSLFFIGDYDPSC